MRQCAEHELRLAEAGILRGDEGDVLSAEARARPLPVTRGREGQPCARMPGDELAQLATRVSTGS